MNAEISPKGVLRTNFNFKCSAAVLILPVLLVVLMAAGPALAQNPATTEGTAAVPSAADAVKSAGNARSEASPPAGPVSARPPWRTRTSPDEGELIELDDVQIHGEIAQPNVAITISRAEPQFRKITLEHVGSDGLTDLDLSGLRGGSVLPAQRIKNWKEILNRPRQ